MKHSVRCLIRKTEIEATPEELVRQELLARMLGSLGFPPGYVTVEKELRQMPHLVLDPRKLPKRRADIICFASGIHSSHQLFPLLLIECKALSITPKAINQIIGYNYFVRSYFIAVANNNEVQTGWYDSMAGQYRFVPYLPSYDSMLKIASLGH